MAKALLSAVSPAAPGRRRTLLSAAALGGAMFALASVGTNVSNVVFHLVAGRLLGSAAYGALGALLAIMGALAVPVAALEAIVTAEVARRVAEGRPFDPSPALRRSLVAGGQAGAVIVLAGPLLAGYLRLGSVWPLVLVGAWCLPLAGGIVPWGMLCGQRRFGTAGGTALAGAVLRIGFAVVLVSAGAGLLGALAASVCADAVRTALLYWACRRSARAARGMPGLRAGVRQMAAGTVAMTALHLLLGLDALLARHLLAAADAGVYVAGTTAARAIFFAAQVGCALLLPRFAVGTESRSRRVLAATLAGTAAIGATATAGLVLVGPAVLSAAFGRQFAVPPALLGLRGLAATALSLLSVLLQYRLSRGLPPGTAPAWLGVAAMLLAGSLWHTSVLALAAAAMVGIAVSLGTLAAAEVRGHSRRARRHDPAEPQEVSA